MRSIKDDMYDEAFRLWDMVPAGTVPGYGSAGSVYRFANGCGHGEYWAYFHDNLFAVNAFDMTFEHAGVMRYRHAEHLSIGYYEAADLIVQSGGSTLRAGAISTYLAEEGAEYVALYQPGSATRATSITISPDYYRDYLQARFGNIPDVRRAFALVDGRTDFPELVALFKQVRAYQGTGMAATLFYEGAVAEALALVIERAAAIEAERAEGSAPSLSKEDRAALDDLSAHINGNLAGALSCEELARRACMGQTKLKAAFKAAYGTSPAAFVADARIERAIELLNSTDEPIAHIARAVGYLPARTVVEAAELPMHALVQIEAVVSHGDGTPPQEVEARHGLIIEANNTDAAPVSALSTQSVAFSHYNNISLLRMGAKEATLVSVDPATGELVAGGAAAQAEQACRNIQAIIESVGHTMDDAVKANVYLRDLADLAAIEDVYAAYEEMTKEEAHA